MPKVVLVTGVSRYLGGRMARILTEDPQIERVVGVDVVPPRMDIGGAEFVRADIRNPIIAKVINAAEVDTVVHMGVIATPVQAGGRMSMKEINVIGTMQLLAACQKSPSVSKLVVKSSTSIYGAGAKDPAMFTEEMEPKHTPGSGWAKDSVEVEGYIRGFARRRPDVSVTTLRFANFLGPRVDTPMSAYFELPAIPALWGMTRDCSSSTRMTGWRRSGRRRWGIIPAFSMSPGMASSCFAKRPGGRVGQWCWFPRRWPGALGPSCGASGWLIFRPSRCDS